MTFDEILAQVVALLQRQGRVSYRALKLRFGLDDDYLEGVKDELIKAKKLAIDEDGSVLVWTDQAATTTGFIQPAGQQPAVQAEADLNMPAASPALGRGAPVGERRQLTVMFCDLVGSTALAGQLDPEDLREVVRAYQQTSAEVIQRFDGHIAQYLGDGLLVYFGWPQAYEDNTQRAVRAGLDIVEAISGLNTRLEQQQGVRLAVRVGIHTGPVVVGEMGSSGRQEQLALGETPNIAARLQGLAAPNQVVIGERTRWLVGGAFDCEDLGMQELKGVAAPMHVYGVRGESLAESRFEAKTATGLTPLVGRDEEISLLLRRWAHAKANEGQVVLLVGEPGIGKSRLTQAVRERIAPEPHIRLQYQCSPYYTNSAFYPIITQLERATRFERDDTPVQKLAKLEVVLAQSTKHVVEVAPLLAALLSIPTDDRYPPLNLTPQRQKEKTMVALVDQLIGLARHQPVLFLWEDVHWSDPTSLEVLDLVVHRVLDAPVLVLITYRPEFVAPWTIASHVTALTLTRLSRSQVVTVVEQLTGGKTLPMEVLEQIVAKTDGVPLFVEELTKTILESGLLREADDHYELTGPLPPLAIPTTLQDSLMARLDRFATVKETAQIGAVIGREFSYELLAAVSPLPDDALQDALDQLVTAELIFRRGQPPEATYTFKHALVQDAAYASLLRSTRQQLHTSIARVLESRFPELVGTEPELVAHHYTTAGLTERAVPYWLKAGQHAIQRSALAEAVRHLTHGLQLLLSLPSGTARDAQELYFQSGLGTANLAFKGWASSEAGAAYTRAVELARHAADPRVLLSVFWGMFAFNLVRGDMHATRANVDELLAIAHRLDDLDLLVVAKMALADGAYWWSEFDIMRGALHDLYRRYEPQRHGQLVKDLNHDPKAIVQLYEAQALWIQGYPDQAIQRCEEEKALSRQIGHPFNLCFSLTWGAMPYLFRKDVDAFLTRCEEGLVLAQEQSLGALVAWGPWFQGWALAQQGQLEEGIARMRQGIAGWHTVGAGLAMPYCRTFLAEFLGLAGRPEEGLEEIAIVEAQIDRWGEVIAAAEVQRVKGELLLKRTPPDAMGAEACFLKALATARHRSAKSWELRAATSFARLWQQQGKRHEARAVLTPVYQWFTEGFDTADLQAAKALLDVLL